ncbi:MAG: DUF1553 domain-containing protein [Planctomycetales bacterium]|nr:DUF1553 domain-containing protein [Planctomycetales bacterium]
MRRSCLKWAIHLFAVAFCSVVACAALAADPAPPEVDFERDIQPLLAKHCYECHGPEAREGGLRLSNRREALLPADSGDPVIVPGDAEASSLLARAMSRDEDEQMPPDGPRLADEQVAVLRRWIATGAAWPEGEAPPVHWAYVRPRRAELPAAGEGTTGDHPIDRFLDARLAAAGLRPTERADRARLIRRASLTLIGLPPSVEEVEAFVHDQRPDAYERLVDRLLASERYGERWARPWLDLARYADSNGFQADQIRESWAYRDWVIAAMNDDMPFDRFVVEQLAGDLLPNATLEQRVATGFHRTVTCNVEAGVHPEQNRTDQIFDRVNTTGTVFLGTTIECCQCHNHKYDPFTQRDYYQLFAYFNNTPLEVKNKSGVTWDFYGPTMDLPLAAEQEQRRAQWQAELTSLRSRRNEVAAQSGADRAAWESEMRVALADPPAWRVLEVEQFESTGGEDHTILDDQSVLLDGTLPDTTVYTITLRLPGEKVSGLKLEALTHESLPGKGPGRGDEERTNFVLHELEVGLRRHDAIEPLTLTQAQADFSQDRWDVAGAIDGDRATGWAIAPQFHKPHWSSFRLSAPLDAAADARLIATLDQNYGRGRVLGRVRFSALVGNAAAADLPEEIVAILRKKQVKGKDEKKLQAFFARANPELTKLDERIAEIEKQIARLQAPTTLVMVEMDQPRETHILMRGDYLNPGKQVNCVTPATLPPIDPAAPKNRLGLARWLVAPENPLLARVTVNRWWAEIFGQGIVATLEDFGTQCEPPTHPELLDWLAVELIENGWSMKQMHRLMVTSAAFQRSARVTPEMLERDPTNQWYARGPRFRLPAEAIRDNALAISGLLSEKMGGPPIMPFQPDGIWRAVGRNAPKWVAAKDENRYRRGIYVVWRRAAPYPSFVNFDAPDRAACVVARPRTNTPLQALTLLNDPAYTEAGLALAQRVLRDRSPASVRERAEYAMRLCVARRPSAEEIDTLVALYESQHERMKNEPAAAQALLDRRAPTQAAADFERVELAAWFYVANALLNLDETITP